MKRLLLLLPLLTLACAQSPKKEYVWTSFSEKGFIKNTLSVNNEAEGFYGNKGDDELVIKKEIQAGQNADGVKKIILMGDTGCRMKEGKWGQSYQNCKDGKDWIYKSVADKIAAEKPDMILHVGDYHYREHCSEGKVCRQYTDVVGYGWRVWEADFFAPSVNAFAAAPWIFVRGNHEDCNRAFEGFKLLSEQNWPENCVKAEKTEYLQVGNLLIVQMDTASVNEKPDTPADLAFWEQQFKDIEARLETSKAKKVWIVTHKPFIGLVENDKGQLQTTNTNLQKAFAKTKLASRVEFLIGGHIHNTQFIRAQGFPKQLVVGNSGTALDENKALANREAILKNKIDGVQYNDFFTDTKTGHSFGYAIMTKMDKDNWQIQFKDTNGEVTFTSLDVAIP